MKIYTCIYVYRKHTHTLPGVVAYVAARKLKEKKDKKKQENKKKITRRRCLHGGEGCGFSGTRPVCGRCE